MKLTAEAPQVRFFVKLGNFFSMFFSICNKHASLRAKIGKQLNEKKVF